MHSDVLMRGLQQGALLLDLYSVFLKGISCPNFSANLLNNFNCFIDDSVASYKPDLSTSSEHSISNIFFLQT